MASGACGPPVASSMASWLKTRARNRLIKGPASAITSSIIGDFGSSSSSAAPPKMNRVTRLIGMPSARPTNVWESSCAMIEKVRPNTPKMAIKT